MQALQLMACILQYVSDEQTKPFCDVVFQYISVALHSGLEFIHYRNVNRISLVIFLVWPAEKYLFVQANGPVRVLCSK